MTATLMPLLVTRIWNTAGTAPLAGGKVWTYEVGTTTPKTSYTDATATVANSNPVILDSTGSASIWISGQYRVNVLDSADVQQPNYPQDNVADFHTIDNITATSTTSLSISTTTATRTFTTQADKFFSIGLPVFIVANGSITNNMYGQVTAYSGTQLTVGIQSGAGSGTFADWTISLSGPPGPTGSTGGSGAGSGDMLGASNLAVGAGGVADAAVSRTNLGLGTAATHDVGTSNTQIPVLDATGYPAANGSQITNLTSGNLVGALPAISGAALTGLSTPTVTAATKGRVVMGALTVQWGVIGSGFTGSTSESFSVAFSGTPYSIQLTPASAAANCVLNGAPTSSGFVIVNTGTPSGYYTVYGPT